MLKDSRTDKSTGCTEPLPVFIFGVARSGTSYTCELLNAHPQIQLTYEGTIATEGDYYYQRHEDLGERSQFDQLMDEFCTLESRRPRNQWIADLIRANQDELHRWHLENPGFDKLVPYIHMLAGDVSAWGSKLLRIERLRDLRKHWPESKMIVLIRDPRAVYLSQRTRFGYRLKYSTIYWNAHSALTRELQADTDHCLVMKYEDLVLDLPGTLAMIFGFIGVQDKQVLDSIVSKMPAKPTSLNTWKTYLTDKEIHEIESLLL